MVCYRTFYKEVVPPEQKPPVDWAGFNLNISGMTGMSDADQNAYLAAVKSVFPPGALGYVRTTRYGIAIPLNGYPWWTSVSCSYWTNFYRRPTASNAVEGRKQMLEPLTWVQSLTLGPVDAPFGRTSDGKEISEDRNTWRTSIRWTLRVMLTDDVGPARAAVSGRPPISSYDLEGVRLTNAGIKLVLGPNEIDVFGNASKFYLTPAELGGKTARVDTPFSGQAGLHLMLLRMVDHQRHTFEACRAFRQDVGVVSPSLIQACVKVAFANFEFNIYDMVGFEDKAAGYARGDIARFCDAFQIHMHMNQSHIPDPWTGWVPTDSTISPWHYWKAVEAVNNIRAATGLPSVVRPLIDGETGLDAIASGVQLNGRDPYLLRRLKYGMLALGNLYYGTCLTMLYSAGRSSATGYNLLIDNKPVGSDGEIDADYAYRALDYNFPGEFKFKAKGWKYYSQGWQVWFNQGQNPIAGNNSVCPWPEWNAVTFEENLVTMKNRGKRNLVARWQPVGPGQNVFSAEVKLSGYAKVKLAASGFDKLDGLAISTSNVFAADGDGETEWTKLVVRFTPRQHNNPRIPDPAVAVLMIDHNGVGVCKVRNPQFTSG